MLHLCGDIKGETPLYHEERWVDHARARRRPRLSAKYATLVESDRNSRCWLLRDSIMGGFLEIS
jgi:hypothetical protein